MKLRRAAHLICCLWLGLAARANTFVAGGSCPGDTRAAVTQPGTPWRCIGKLSLPGTRFMTASLVGPNLILTAAHGLVKNGRLKSGDFIFRPDFGSPHNPAHDSARVTKAWLGSYAPEAAAFRHADWAILQIDANLGDTYGTLDVEDAVDTALPGSAGRYYLASYDRDFERGRKASWQTGCGFVQLGPPGCLLHDFSTTNGASGAPIFHFAGVDQTARIVALNVAEVTRKHGTLTGVPFSPDVANLAVPAHEFYGTLTRLRHGDGSLPGEIVRRAGDSPSSLASP
jgi:hypothetical protein